MKPSRVSFLKLVALVIYSLHSKYVMTHGFIVGTIAPLSLVRHQVSRPAPRIQLISQIDDTEENFKREEMRHLIITLSKEKNDETRRTKLGSLLCDKVSESTAEAHSFLDEWDKMLIEIGSTVQNQARENLSSTSKISLDETTYNSIHEMSGREKSDIELQVWALIDMMVQSKAFMKKTLRGLSE